MIGGFLPYWMNNQTLLPWSSAIGNMNDFSYFNSPNLWLQMQMMQNPIQMPGCDFSIQNAYNQGFQLAERMDFTCDVSKTRQDIGKLKQELTNILAQRDLPAEKKQKFEEIKQLLEETERKMQEFIQRTQSQDIRTSKAELAAMKEELAALKQAATQVASAVDENNNNNNGANGTNGADGNNNTSGADGTNGVDGNNNSTTGTEGNSGTNGTAGASGSTGTTGTSSTGGANGADENEPTETEKAAYKKALGICKDIFVAVDGPLTDNDKLDKAVMSIDKDNVIFVLDKWLLDYQSKTGDDSLIETIYDDIFSGDDRKKYTEHILKALVEKADKLGIDISPEQAVIENQLSRWWRSDSSIYQAFIDIHTKLTNIPLVEETEEQPAA